METWLTVVLVIIALVLVALLLRAAWRSQVPDLTMQGLLGTKKGGWPGHDPVEDYKMFTGVKYQDMVHRLNLRLMPPPTAESIKAALRVPRTAVDGAGPPPGIRNNDWEVARTLSTFEKSFSLVPPEFRQTTADYIRTVLALAPDQQGDDTVYDMLVMGLTELDQ
jgi:hypothetical protein